MEASKIKKLYNFPINKLTSFKQAGVIKTLFIIENLDDLNFLSQYKNKFNIIGNGSNSLIKKSAETTLFIKMSPNLSPISLSDNFITVGAGVLVNQLLKYSQEKNITGFEFMAGVPASVGGMIAMNFGCWNVEASDLVESVEVFCMKKGIFKLSKKECKFNYRSSIFQKKNWLILNATFKIKILDTNLHIKNKIQQYVKERVEKQPIRTKTFGSIFKNPASQKAAILIEKAGLKGFTINQVGISNRHANFMENINNGSAENTIEVLDYIIEKVYKLFKIKLSPEVVIFND